MEPMAKPAYRADIDGLRAVAVVPVVLFHAGLPGFSGGYVGVDIFFVISGFLITGIIAREVDEARFSLWHFYERRARRILPALFAMIAFVLVAASLLYLPADYADVPRSALAALFFAGNLWFFTQAGYFQQTAETMPLLHTWSLGVEEQFYIFFPLALMLIAAAMPRWRTALVWVAFALSLALAVLTQNAGDGFAFYFLPARAWELLAGSLLALGAIPAIRGRVLREGAALAGLAAIIFAVVLYNESTVFPGITALLPVLGSALLIHSARGTRVGAVLGSRAFVWIGLISYSLYLWHWPLIVFAIYAKGAPLDFWQSAGIVALSVVVSWASLVWIETPWRDRERHSRGRVFAFSAAGLVVLGGMALALTTLGGWATRFPPEVARIAEAARDRSPARDTCFVKPGQAMSAGCTLGAEGAPPDALVWGDSHAVEFAWALGETARLEGRAIEQRTMGSCAPILTREDAEIPDCAGFNDATIARIEGDPAIRTVYLAGFWAGGRYHSAEDARLLDRTIARIAAAGRDVVLIGAVARQSFDVPRALSRHAAFGANVPPARSLAQHRADTAWLTDRYDAWRAGGVRIVEPERALFDRGVPRIAADSVPLYFDSHHLTLAGARRVLETDRAEAGGDRSWKE